MTQHEKILNCLKDGNFHSTIELRDLFIMQSATRIFELKEQGYEIESKLMPYDGRDGAKVAWYKLKLAKPVQNTLDINIGRAEWN